MTWYSLLAAFDLAIWVTGIAVVAMLALGLIISLSIAAIQLCWTIIKRGVSLLTD